MIAVVLGVGVVTLTLFEYLQQSEPNDLGG